MKYKKGDIVIVKSAAGKDIPSFHVQLIEKIYRKPPKDPEYVIWRCKLTKKREADKLRKEWQIQFKFPDEVETYVYETSIIRRVNKK
tara:strand:+ start:684 stop:944 length:261 start_codon:yes stop_codon:yes gene_type:complete